MPIMLKLQKKFVKKELWKHKIVADVDFLIDKMYEDGKINEFMTNDTILTITLINLSLKRPIYKRLLNKNYLFDLEFNLVNKQKENEENFNLSDFDENIYDLMIKSNNNELSLEIQELISDILNPQIDYTFVSCMMDRYYVMVKYKDILEDYNKIQNTLEMKLQKNEMIKQKFDVIFNEKIINVSKSDLKNKYEELIRHVKAIKLPLQVIDDECFGLSVTYRDLIEVYIELEYSDKWPKDSHAVEYAKTAFYCEIYKRSKFKHFVDESCVVLKYKGVYFKLIILENMKMDVILRKNFYKSLDSLTKTVPKIKNNILMVKKYLSSHGYYPFYLNDLIVDVICLSLERIDCPSRFLKEFLKFNFEYKKINVETLEVQESPVKRFSIFKKLDNFFIDLPESSVIKRLKLLNKIQTNNNFNLLETNYNDFDFCLSYSPRKDFLQIEESGVVSKFIDWEVLNRKEVKKNAYIYYSDYNKMVMIKGKDNCDITGLFYYLLSTTSFKYYFKK